MPASDAVAGGLEGRVAFITGSGARRVGRAVAELFAERGYAIGLHANSSTAAAEAAAAEFASRGTPAMVVRGDVRDEATVKQWIAEIVARFGRLRVLVNAAAVWERKRPEAVTADDGREAAPRRHAWGHPRGQKIFDSRRTGN